MAPGESIPLLGDVFRLTHVENRAGVMGISILPLWLLTLISLPAVGYMLFWLWRRLPAQGWMERLLPWILGGAAGNLWDRVVRHRVTDMFDVDMPDITLGAFHLERWWVFNLADSYIFVCMIVLLALGFTGRLEEPAKSPAAGPEAGGGRE